MVNKAKKHGVDIKSLVEKNNKLWQQKYEAAEHEFEKKMKDTEEKYSSNLKEKTLLFE
jgi:hypothetical protein